MGKLSVEIEKDTVIELEKNQFNLILLYCLISGRSDVEFPCWIKIEDVSGDSDFDVSKKGGQKFSLENTISSLKMAMNKFCIYYQEDQSFLDDIIDAMEVNTRTKDSLHYWGKAYNG